MKILKIDPVNPEKGRIDEAVEVVKNDGLVVYPTETVYGLGANPFSKKAVRKIFEAKRRHDKPISIAVRDLHQAKRLARFNSLALKLAKKFLPGPLTLILPMRTKFPGEKFPGKLTLGRKSIGIRIPDHAVAQALLEKVKVLTTTSANISGGKNPVTAAEAIEQIGDKVDLFLDSGACKFGIPSTVADLTEGIKILREGVISREKIFDVK